MTKATPAHQEIQKVLDELRIRIEDLTVVLAGMDGELDDNGVYNNCVSRIEFRAKQIIDRRQAYTKIQQLTDELKTLSEDYPDIIESVRKS